MKKQRWHRWLWPTQTLGQKHWISIGFGIVATIAVLGLWQQLRVQERLHVEQLLQQEVGAIKAEFYQELNARVQTLQRVANRWQAGDTGTPQDIWEADAAALVKDFNDYQAFAWVDPSFQVHRIVPVAEQAILDGSDFSLQSPHHVALNQAKASRGPILSRQPGQKFLALVPLMTGDRFDGAIVGVLRPAALFNNLFRVPDGYQLRLYDRDALIYGQPLQAHSPFKTTIKITDYGLNWTLEVTLHPELIAASRSPLPGVILVGGLAIVWILAFILSLAQQARAQAHRVKRINQQLQAEIIQRLQAETYLRISNQVMESAVLGISRIDRHGRYHYANKAYAALAGYQPQEMIGMSWEQTVHPDERPKMRLAYAQMVQAGRVEIETKGIRQDGSEFYKQLVLIAAYDEQHQLQEHYCFMKDITERKQADTALQESEARYRHLINHLNAGFIVHAPDSQILQCNATACHLLGLPMDQLLGKEAIDAGWHFVREDGTVMPIAEYPVNRVLATQAPLDNYVLGISRENTVQFWVLVSAFPEFDAHLQLTQVVATFIDISELKRAEVALSRSEERLSLVLKGSNEGWWDWDLTKNDLYYSPRWWGILGYEPEELDHTPELWQQLTHPDDVVRVTEFFQQQLVSAVESYEVELRLRHKQGHYVSVVSRGYISRDESGTPIRVSGTNTDLSDRKAAELALKQSESIFRSFFNSGAMLMGIVEMHGDDILHLSDNQASATFFGTTPEAMKNRFASEMGVPQSHLQQWLGHYREAERTQSPVRFEYLHQAPTGQYWLAASVSLISNSSSVYPRFSYIVEDITDRKQAKLALEKELLQSKTLFNTSIDGIVVLNHQGNVIQTSASFAQMIGYSVEEALNLNVADWHAQWTSEELQLKLTQGDLPPTFETQHRRKNGSCFDVEISYSRVNLEGELIHFCICRDISDRKRIESEREQALKALQQSESTKQAIIQAIPDLLIRMYSDGHYIEFISNKEFNIVKPEQRRHDVTVCEILPPDLAQLRLQHTHQALQLGTTQIYEQEIVLDGKQRYEEVRIVPVQPQEVLIMVRDITDRKQAEAELKHQKNVLQTIVNHIPIMIAVFNSSGRIEFLNPEFEKVLGWPLADWQQRNVLLECYPDPASYQTVVEHMLAVNGQWKDFTTQTKSGQQIETSWANIRLSNGSNLGIGQDISDRKHKEVVLQHAMEAAEAANLAKSIFLANMSHELRTPLNVILGFTQVMARDPSLTTTQRQDLQTIRRSGDHLLSLINDVLDLSKIEAGRCEIEEAEFDLIGMLSTLRAMMLERAMDKHLRLEFDIAKDVPQFVISDAQKLRQILLNLLSNAIKFTHSGSVMLRVKRHEPDALARPCCSTGDLERLSSLQLQFDVSDTGVGIAPHEQDTIFDAFVQADAGKKSISGTGLGLTISRKLLKLMHGEITLQSIPTLGSTFTITLPVYSVSHLNGAPEKPDRLVIGLAPGQPSRRILVVDDQRENRLVLVRLLTQLGLDVKEATNGQEAIHLWKDWHPELTLMDIRMPGLDGYETTRQIRTEETACGSDGEPLYSSPSIIIALTAQASEADRAVALAAGCNDYISKPFQEKTLLLKLEEYLSLAYRYAQPAPLLSSFDHGDEADNSLATILTPNLLAQLSEDWLQDLENAAICGNNRAIAALAAQLPPEYAPLSQKLTECSEQFQFEQILQVFQRTSPPTIFSLQSHTG